MLVSLLGALLIRGSEGTSGVGDGVTVGFGVEDAVDVGEGVFSGVETVVGAGVGEVVEVESVVTFAVGVEVVVFLNTTTVTVPTFLVFLPNFSRTEILAVPVFLPVTFPFLETAATRVLEDLYV